MGALLYFGFVTEYHTLKFEKEGEPVQDYAMPLAVTGTVCLVFGMLICAHVVNKASEETIWELANKEKRSIAMVWLQKRKLVSDQQFESKAIYPEQKRNQIVNSARAIGLDPEDAGKRVQTGTRGQSRYAKEEEAESKRKEEEKVLVRWLQILSFIGVFISIGGSVCQFTGLRGMHWTASIAQLGAVALATFIRAVVRRALTHKINQTNLMSGYELDWFAMSLSNIHTAVWLPPAEKDEGNTKTTRPAKQSDASWKTSHPSSSWSWTIHTGLPFASIKADNHQFDPQCYRVDELGTSQSILDLRRSLGELGNWKSPVYSGALALSKAIEVTMDHFAAHLRKPEDKWFSWTLQVKASGHSMSKRELIEVRVKKETDGWKAPVDALEAALSLWLYSVYSSNGKLEEERPPVFPSCSDDWIRGKKMQEKCLQIIGPCTFRLVQDLGWWMPDGLEGIMTSGMPKRDEERDEERDKEERYQRKPDNEDRYQQERHQQEPDDNERDDEKREQEAKANCVPHDVRIERIGRAGWRSLDSGDFQISERQSNPVDGKIIRWDCKPTCLSEINTGNTKGNPANDFLVVDSQGSLAMLYAKDMFASFVWALADQLKPSSVGEGVKATVQPRSTRDWEPWKNFTLRSPWLSRLVQSLLEIGPWTEREVYLSLIAPLSDSDNLPGLDAVVDRTFEFAAVEEKARRYQAAAETYLWIHETAKAFPPTSYVYWKSVAALMRFRARLSGLQVPFSASQIDDWYRMDHSISTVRAMVSSTLDDIKFPLLQQKLQEVFDIYNVLTHGALVAVSGGCELDFDVKGAFRVGGTQGHKGIWDIFNRVELHHAARSTCVYEHVLNDDEDTLVGPWSDANWLISDICKPLADSNTWANIVPRHHNKQPERWNPIGWQVDFTAALIEPMTWLQESLHHNTNPNAQDLDHWTPLHYACYTVLDGHDVKSNETVQKTLTDLYRQRAIFWARILIRSKADVNAQGLDGMTPLHCATISGNSELVDLLIDNNADVAAEDAQGLRPLHFAALWGAPSQFERLSKSPAKIDIRDNEGRTPLHFAALTDATESIQQLCQCGATIDIEDSQGRTPLHFAARQHATKAIIELCRFGAMIDAKDSDDLSPLANVFSWEDSRKKTKLKTALELIKMGASVDVVISQHKRNLLHYAAEDGLLELAKVLIEKSKSLREMLLEKDCDRKTPRDLVGSKEDDMARFLDEALRRFGGTRGGLEVEMPPSAMDERDVWKVTEEETE